jgi:hypothetical protein
LEKTPDRSIGRLEVLSEEEREKVVEEWNRTEVEYGEEKCVQELFEEQVERTPEAIAVVSEEVTLSYEELNRRANGKANAIVVLLRMMRFLRSVTRYSCLIEGHELRPQLAPRHKLACRFLGDSPLAASRNNREWVACTRSLSSTRLRSQNLIRLRITRVREMRTAVGSLARLRGFSGGPQQPVF